jgi:Ca2+-binding EF-hand superfamily protein
MEAPRMDARLDRIKAAFHALDTDSNGYLESSDFDRLGSRIIQALEAPESSPKAQALRAGCRLYWQGLVAALDLNHDGKISWEEYTRFHEPEQFEANVSAYADALVAICDRDDDGYVQHEELVRGLRAVGFPRDNIEALFAAFDPHGTGQVAAREWRDAITDYFLAKGSHAVVDTLA